MVHTIELWLVSLNETGSRIHVDENVGQNPEVRAKWSNAFILSFFFFLPHPKNRAFVNGHNQNENEWHFLAYLLIYHVISAMSPMEN